MSAIKHLIENAIEEVANNGDFDNWKTWEEQYGNYKSHGEFIKATPEEIWEIAVYVVCTLDMTK